MSAARYLRVIGRLYPDGRLRLRPGYLAERPPWRDQEGDLAGLPELDVLNAELFDDAGASLGRHPVRTYPVCAFGAGSSTLAVRGWVPFHPDTRTMRLASRGRIVHEQRRASEPPRLEITEAPGERAEGRIRIGWDAAAGGDGTLQFFLRWSCDDGRSWQRIGWRTADHSMEVDVDDLPGGEQCRFAVVATDGLDTTIARSQPFSVALKPCQAIVIAPIDGSEVEDGATLELLGHGWWLEESRAERDDLVWTSSLDGALGRGEHLLARLSPGTHQLTLTAGGGRRGGEESVVVQVGRRTSGGA